MYAYLEGESSMLIVWTDCHILYLQYMNKDYVKNNYENLHNVLHT